MAIACILDGQVVEQRNIAMPDVPEHKRSLWRSVPARPLVDPRVETLSGPILQGDELVWIVAPRSPEEVSAVFAGAIQGHIDALAASRGYANGFALAGYISSTISAWAAEAAAFIAWRDSVWLYAYGELAKVQNGQRDQPTVEALLSELPTIEWPA